MKKMLPRFAVAAAAFLFFPLVHVAQAPVLGTAANFVLFTSDGAVTNGGVTAIVTGNVGSNGGGSVTGFGNVNGVVYNGGTATAQAAVDLLVAYNQLNIATPTATLAPNLGNGQTLIAGVYNIPSTASLNLDLTFDAQGNPNAVFIMKIGGAFSTNASSKVKLINGALACNVFWKVEGLVDMAAATFMRGTVIANQAAIVMHVNDTLEGRAFSTTGAITVDGIQGYTPLGCGTLPLTGPAAPALGSAACYALFSGSGAVTNSGTTNVTGDIGTNFGVTSGYDPLLVNGTIHANPDASTVQAALDLGIAYNYLNTLPHEIELLFPAQFGNELVLTPHTYLMNSAAPLNGTVYLNAQGNANAVFVIKINGGALSTAANARVVLINQAQAKNVYWKVEGAVNITNSSFVGTLVGNGGIINLSSGANISGRVFATNNAINSAAILAISPAGDCRTLPVDWLYFRGNPAQQNVLLEWATTNEMNNGFFTIEKSRDGSAFETLSTVPATKATGTAERSYAFTDERPYSLGYYRISQTDKDGQVNNYRTIQVKLKTGEGLDAKHYVQGNYIYVRTTGAVPGNGSITLFSIDGKKLSTQKIVLSREANTYKIVKSLQKGIYVIYIESRGEKLYQGKVMVQ